jgi:glycosyltransferase involved in cell wall biosynthesis
MKLVVEVTTCTSERTGIGYYTEHLVDALIATAAPGDEVALIGNRELAPLPAEKWAGRVRTDGARIRYIWMQRDAGRMIEEVGADFALFPNYLAPLVSPCPYVNVVHDLALIRTPQFFNARKRLLVRPLLPVVARGAVAVGTVSEASRRDVTALLGVAPERIVMLPGAPHPACRPPAADEIARVRARYGLTRPYVLTVGTLEPRKNLPMLLRAFDRLRAHSGTAAAELDLVAVGGKGWRDRDLRAELALRLSSGRVHLLGYVPESDLVALYGGAVLMAYPSHFEGFGLPVVEAMACGTPVVATDVEALHEVSGGAAILVPPGDDGALAEQIARLAGDAGAREVARARGLSRAQAFTWESTAERLWSLAHATRARRPAGRRSIADTADTAPAGSVPSGADPRDWAIAATVAYADLFEAAITVEEIARSCLGLELGAEEIRRRAAAGPLAAFLALDGGDHLTFRGREALIPRRADGIQRTSALLERHRRVIAALAALPFIRMLALSGGTAHRNARGGDDIDLFVVAAAGHVYTAYTMLFLASRLTRTRGVVCPNYLVDENHLQIAYHHDLFTAHQALSLVPIAGQAAFDRFVDANRDWVRDFYPGYVPRPAAAHLEPTGLQRIVEGVLGVWGSPIERLLAAGWRFHLGQRVARAPQADVVVSGGILKLHLSDHRRRVLARFEAKLGGLRAKWATAMASATPGEPLPPPPSA